MDPIGGAEEKGQVMAHEYRQIVNPRTGQAMIFRRTAADTDGQLLQIECYHEPGGPPEPKHTHPHQESRFEVLSGLLRFRIGGNERTAGPGEVVTIPANASHSFWNDGDGVAHYLQEFRPALDSEHFFETLFGLAQAGKLDARGMPTVLALPVLVSAMGDAIRPVSPPWPLVRGVAWLLGPLARVRGYSSLQPQVPTAQPNPHHTGDRQAIRERLTAA